MKRCFKLALIGDQGNLDYQEVDPLPVALWDHAVGSMEEDRYICVSGGTTPTGITSDIILYDV